MPGLVIKVWNPAHALWYGLQRQEVDPEIHFTIAADVRVALSFKLGERKRRNIFVLFL